MDELTTACWIFGGVVIALIVGIILFSKWVMKNG